MKKKDVKYKELSKSSLVKLGVSYDRQNDDSLYKFLQANQSQYRPQKPLPTVVKESGEIVEYSYYHNLFETSAKYELLRDGNVRNFVKKFPGNTQFLIKTPVGFKSSYEYYSVNGIYKALELAHCLLLEGDNSKISISNKYNKEIFYIEWSSEGVLTGKVIKETIKDNGEDSLEKILNDLCGLADHVSYALSDNDTAEKMDRIGTRFSNLVKLLIKEEK